MCLNLLDIWGHRIRNAVIGEGLDNESLPDSKKIIANVIKQYYFEKPQLERSVTIMFFSFVSLILSVSSKIPLGEYTEKILSSSAYCVMLANIIISEIVIIKWRRQRDMKINTALT